MSMEPPMPPGPPLADPGAAPGPDPKMGLAILQALEAFTEQLRGGDPKSPGDPARGLQILNDLEALLEAQSSGGADQAGPTPPLGPLATTQ